MLKKDRFAFAVNWFLNLLIALTALVILPVQIVSTFVISIIVTLTFGLLLIPINIIWLILFWGPLLILSWLWWKAPLLRIPIAIIGVAVALVGHIYVCVMPSMKEMDARYSKLIFCECWPYTFQLFLTGCHRPIFNIHIRTQFLSILEKIGKHDQFLQPSIERLQSLVITSN